MHHNQICQIFLQRQEKLVDNAILYILLGCYLISATGENSNHRSLYKTNRVDEDRFIFATLCYEILELTITANKVKIVLLVLTNPDQRDRDIDSNNAQTSNISEQFQTWWEIVVGIHVEGGGAIRSLRCGQSICACWRPDTR